MWAYDHPLENGQPLKDNNPEKNWLFPIRHQLPVAQWLDVELYTNTEKVYFKLIIDFLVNVTLSTFFKHRCNIIRFAFQGKLDKHFINSVMSFVH